MSELGKSLVGCHFENGGLPWVDSSSLYHRNPET